VEYWINEDGSGKDEVTFDLGEMATMMIAMMDSDSTSPKKNLGNNERIDSTAVFYDIIPDSIKEMMSSPHLLRDISLHMLIDQDNEEMNIRLISNYKSSKHKSEILQAFSEMNKIKAEQRNSRSMMAQAPTDEMTGYLVYHIDWDQNSITIPREDVEESLAEEGMDLEDMMMTMDTLRQVLDSIDMAMDTMNVERRQEANQIKGMLEMLLGNEMKMIIHCPKPIWFTNDPTALIEGKTVTFISRPMDFIMNGEKPPAYDLVIKMKDN